MKRCLFLAVLILCSFGQIHAQLKVSGKITDNKGEVVIGATITVKGTTQGTISKLDGTYEITNVPANGILKFSYLGMSDLEIEVNNQTIVNATLEEDVLNLDEVVVIGYGAVRKRDLIGAVASVKSSEIVKAPTYNAIEAIQGKVPGVDITRSSGAAGAGVNILIRGTRSINGKNEPLYIIDGVQGGSISDLNPDDIESIEVLKDASSTAIYGYQGAGGVIIITTKKGKEGTIKIAYNGYYGVNGLTPYPKGRMGQDYINLRREAYRSNNAWSTPADDEKIFTIAEWNAIQNNQWVDWTDLLLTNGTIQNHQVSVNGGSEKMKSYFSAGYFNEVGAIKDDYSRYNARLNVDYIVSKWLKTGMQTQVTYIDQNKRKDALSKANSSSPLGTPYDDEGNIVVFPMAGDGSSISPLTDFRPNAAADNTLTTRVLANGYLEVTPLPGLSLRTDLSTNLENTRRGISNDSLSMTQAAYGYNAASITSNNNKFLSWENVLTYTNEINEHSFTLTAISSYTQSNKEDMSASGYGQLLSSQLFYDLDATQTSSQKITSGYSKSNTLSYAGRLNYSFKGKYLFTATERLDGSSVLAPGHKWSSFPSVAVGWRISEEEFLKNVSQVSNLKLRLSYGVAGNATIGAYDTQSTLAASSNMSFGEVAVPSYTYNELLASKVMTWERSATTNLGFDIGLFKNRISTTVELYKTTTSGILLKRLLPVMSGGMSSGSTTFKIWQNIGTTENKGIELAINTINVNTKNFSWTTTLSYGKNIEKIVRLIDNHNIIQQEENSLLIGYPIKSVYYLKKLGIWQISDSAEMKIFTPPYKAGDIKVADMNGDTLIDGDDRTYIGSFVPDWVCGLQNTVTYRWFDFSIYLFARWGQTIKNDLLGRYNPSGNGNGPAFIDYWTPENPTNDFPRPKQGSGISDLRGGYQPLIYVDGSFFKIKNISLGYTLPKSVSSKFNISKFRIYATASNILTVAKSHLVQNYDPENGGSEGAPMSKQVIFGINLDF